MTDTHNDPQNTVEQDSEKLLDSRELHRAKKSRKPSWKIQFFAIIVVALVTFMTFSAARYFLAEESQKVETQLKQRMEIMVLERADIFATWLNGMAEQVRPITQSDVFRVFAAEVDLADGDMASVLSPNQDQALENEVGGMEQGFREQLPFMVNALTDLVQDSGHAGAYMLDRRGNTFLTSIDAKPLLQRQKDKALQLFDTKQIAFSPFRESVNGLELDIYIPVLPTEFMENTNDVVGVFIFTVNVTDKFEVLLRPNPISGLDGSYSLFQRIEGQIQEVRAMDNGGIFDTPLTADIFADEGLAFGQRSSFDNMAQVYSFAVPVGEDTDFILAWQTASADARSYLDKLIVNVYLIAILFVLSFLTAFGAFWWRSNSDYNRMMANEYADFARKIARQKKLLNGITSTIKEFITLKDKHGKYVYVNPAFAEAVGRPVDDILGLDSASVLGHRTAERLEKLDEMTLSSNKPTSTVDEIYFQGEKRHVQISKVPLITEEEQSIVTVGRDITDFIEEQERRDKSVKQMVQALVRAVELRDPHLAGHSRRVSEFAGAIAHELSSDAKVKRTVEIAANLSQIGKINIPRDILVAERRLTNEEIDIMQGHVESATKILSEIDFDVPVKQTVSQMYERLDGSGYPQGLKDDEISLEARILGVCDYFCARIEPRSYRQAILPKEAISFLEQNADKYDAKVVQALKQIVHSSLGEKLIASVTVENID